MVAARHGIRLKVSPGPGTSIPIHELTTLAMEPRVRLVRGRMNARDVALLREFVELHRDVLVKHWNRKPIPPMSFTPSGRSTLGVTAARKWAAGRLTEKTHPAFS